jgi:hypothetical protein
MRVWRASILEWTLASFFFVFGGVVSALFTYWLPFLDEHQPKAIGFAECWIPGFIFGFVFGTIHMKQASSSLAFACVVAVSDTAATLAGLYGPFTSAFDVLNHVGLQNVESFLQLPVYGTLIIAGPIGALLTGRAASVFLDLRHSVSIDILNFAVGEAAVLTGLFLPNIAKIHQTLGQFLFVAIPIYHLMLGACLSWWALTGPKIERWTSFDTRLNALLTGPVVQLFGVIGFLYSIIEALFSVRQ